MPKKAAIDEDSRVARLTHVRCWFSPNRFGTNWTSQLQPFCISVLDPTSGGQDVATRLQVEVRCQSLASAGRSDSCVWATPETALHDPVNPGIIVQVCSVDDELENCPVPSLCKRAPRQRMDSTSQDFLELQASRPRPEAQLRYGQDPENNHIFDTDRSSPPAPARLLLGPVDLTPRRRKDQSDSVDRAARE